MTLNALENDIVILEQERKEMLKRHSVIEQEKGKLKLESAKIRVKILELDELLEKSKHEMDINSFNLSLAKKRFWNEKSEITGA